MEKNESEDDAMRWSGLNVCPVMYAMYIHTVHANSCLAFTSYTNKDLIQICLTVDMTHTHTIPLTNQLLYCTVQ